MAKPGWVDYSGAAPILLPVSLLRYWQGFYVAADADDDSADLELPQGRFNVCDDFDFAQPKTDYDCACALSGTSAVQPLPVGPGHGLVFATELDAFTWRPEALMLVNGGSLPDPALLRRVAWTDELAWRTAEADFVLMSACDHGADPDKGPHFTVTLEPGAYTIQRGTYGWADDDPWLVLFRFVPRPAARRRARGGKR
jgi:Immunity protein 21